MRFIEDHSNNRTYFISRGVPVPDEFDQVREWCNAQFGKRDRARWWCEGKFDDQAMFTFIRQDDAFAFKLRWF